MTLAFDRNRSLIGERIKTNCFTATLGGRRASVFRGRAAGFFPFEHRERIYSKSIV